MKRLLLSLLFITSAIAGEYKLVGTHKLEVTMFGIDVYNASYFKDGDNNKITLKYLRDVEKKYSVEGWEKGLAKYDTKEEKEARKWLINTSEDIKEGDVLELIEKENKLIITLNGKITHQNNDKLIAKLALAPWIGKYPAKKEMKNDLIGK
jgi:hypothetical protein